MSGRSSAVDYDEIGRIYDSSRWANRETLEKLARLLSVGSDSTILDLGCGTGNYAGPLGHAAKTVVGVDLSTGMLKQARAKFASLQLVRGDVTALPFASESFDGAFAVQWHYPARRSRRGCGWRLVHYTRMQNSSIAAGVHVSESLRRTVDRIQSCQWWGVVAVVHKEGEILLERRSRQCVRH